MEISVGDKSVLLRKLLSRPGILIFCALQDTMLFTNMADYRDEAVSDSYGEWDLCAFMIALEH